MREYRSCRNLFILLVILFHYVASDFVGKPCAFADVNYDQMTDIVAILDSQTVVAYIQSVEQNVIETTQPSRFTTDERFQLNITEGDIVDCHLADFDSDTALDILLVIKFGSTHTIQLYWGSRNSYGFIKPANANALFSLTDVTNNIMVINYDLNLMTEILVQNNNQTFSVIRCADYQDQTMLIDSDVFGGFKGDPSFIHSYADILKHKNSDATDSDLIPDLMFGSNCTRGQLCQLSVYQVDAEKKWEHAINIPPPAMQSVNSGTLFHSGATVQFAGDLTLADLNADGYYDLLQPLCGSTQCMDSAITLAITTHQNGTAFKWITLLIDLVDSTSPDAKPSYKPVMNEETKSFQLRAGDYTRNGYPDLLILLENKNGGNPTNRRIVLLENKPCIEDNCVYSRMFVPQFKEPMMVIKTNAKITNMAFFDVEENGVLDILYEYDDGVAIRFDFEYTKNFEDSTFLKAEVYSAACSIPCGFNRREGSVVSMPGATLKYESVDEKYNSIKGIHTQLNQCGRRALTLPFAIFGLGRSPNFVERLFAATPSIPTDINTHQWEQIIPNSRAFIIPSADGSWILRLYLTPSRLVLLSFLAMVILGALSLIVIVLLWCRERQQDQREKMLQAHRFDFNAM